MTFSDPFFWGSLHFSQSVSRASWMWAEKRMKTCKIEVKYIATAAGASQTVHCHTAPLCKASCLVKTSRDNYKFSKLKYCLGIILNTITHTREDQSPTYSKFEGLKPSELLQGVQRVSECMHTGDKICIRNERKRICNELLISKFTYTEI
jgi:hypothetical protein